ncbi:VWA domain-containing protein [Rossellomorea marisflavi]|uniref:VWA domain-containing protein n=1 Tax=Rossellomorea marisflavi TaxID=189381 RepID=UPI001EE31D81|nr:VWA domain-containing protein [Rossellomorea marisflavi]UKS66970.1 VWA domain-containing protein [Rossellomorea marisflavi]
MGINIHEPLWFLLVLPVIAVLYLYVKRGRFNKEKRMIMIIRCLTFLLLITALTDPYLTLPQKGKNVIFLADRSASINDSADDMMVAIEDQVTKKKETDAYGIVSFAKGAALEQSLSSKESEVPGFSGEVGEDETNIQNGLEYASNLLGSSNGGRIVLYSDGIETLGAGEDIIPKLKDNGIEVDWVKRPSNGQDDVAVTSVNSPALQYKGEEATVSVTLHSTTQTSVDLQLDLNGNKIARKQVKVQEGNNEFEFQHTVDETGMLVYRAEIYSDTDARPENNQLSSIARAEGDPLVLLVHDDGKKSRLEEQLKSAGFRVEALQSSQLPDKLSSYLDYQTILFDNVAATDIPEEKMNLMEQAVKEFGRGFIMFGGDESFALGGYFKTPIEKLLPVDMEVKGKKELPSLGLVLVIDRSGSMDGQKLSLAKEAAARTVSLLREKDTLGVLAFDDRPWEIVPTEPIKDRKKAEEKIRTISPGGGTNIYPSLEEAYVSLQDRPLKRKHIILLTDGQSAAGGDYDTLIEGGLSKGVTLSTVAIGSDADRYLLEDLSQIGNGRFYDVVDASVIPSILTRETVITTRTYIEDQPFYPTIQSSKWQKLFESGMPRMNAYIATSSKDSAQVELASDKKDPILATWRYGLGTTFAFTSDTKGQWAGDFASWKGWPEFINQLVTRSFPSIQSSPYSIELDGSGEKTKLLLTSPDSGTMPLTVSVLAEDGKQVEATSRILSPGVHEVEFDERLSPGVYSMSIGDQALNQAYETGFAVPYSEEYSYQGGSVRTVEGIVKETGGKTYDSGIDAFRSMNDRPYNEQSIRTFLILLAFLLFFAEVALRRFGLPVALATVGEKFGRKVQKNNGPETTRRRPAKVLDDTHSRREEPVPVMQDEPEPSAKPKLKPKPQVHHDPDRMKRLLDAKNRRNK